MVRNECQRFIIHVGTHKTGTTSIQYFLRSHSTWLVERGFYIPRSGCPDEQSGHHNIAWELNSDPRFDPSYGTIKDLLREVCEHQYEDIIVSSEDFEYLSDDNNIMTQFFNNIRQQGFEPYVLVWVREQASYALSLYYTLSPMVQMPSFRNFVHEISTYQEFRRGRWRYLFNYELMLLEWSKIIDGNVIFRSYDTAVGQGSIVDDLMEVLDIREPLPNSTPRLNQSNRKPGPIEMTFRRTKILIPARALVRVIGGPHIKRSLKKIVQIVNRKIYEKQYSQCHYIFTDIFYKSNNRLNESHGVNIGNDIYPKGRKSKL